MNNESLTFWFLSPSSFLGLSSASTTGGGGINSVLSNDPSLDSFSWVARLGRAFVSGGGPWLLGWLGGLVAGFFPTLDVRSLSSRAANLASATIVLSSPPFSSSTSLSTSERSFRFFIISCRSNASLASSKLTRVNWGCHATLCPFGEGALRDISKDGSEGDWRKCGVTSIVKWKSNIWYQTNVYLQKLHDYKAER